MPLILDFFKRILVPALTHWNHPGFLAYFATSGSGPGVLAEFLTAALNQQSMLWRKLTADGGYCNSSMPLLTDGGVAPILRAAQPAEFQRIERWINEGAKNN
mgnify:CR=1 FL=1